MSKPSASNSTDSSPKRPSSSHGPILTPSSTPSATPQRSCSTTRQARTDPSRMMDSTQAEEPSDHTAPPEDQSAPQATTKAETSTAQEKSTSPTATKSEVKRHKHKHKKRSNKAKKQAPSSDESSESSDDDESDDSVSSADSSSDENDLPKKKKKKAGKRKAAKAKKKQKKDAKRSKHAGSESDSEDSDSSDSENDSPAEERRRRRQNKIKARKRRDQDDESDDEDTDGGENAQLRARIAALSTRAGGLQMSGRGRFRGLQAAARYSDPLAEIEGRMRLKSKKKKKAGKRASTLEYKRVDQLWDSSIHNYKLSESAEDQEDEFDQYVFTVRRKFDWENKYKNTVVDIKSKLLREALQEVMKEVKGVSLVEDQPSVDPNMLFLYLEELRKYAKKTLKAKAKAEKKRKNKKRLNLMIAQCKVLIGYLDDDYAETKKTLYPMLEAGNITFDLLWALFKPNSIVYTSTYGSVEDPRCFKVDYATKEASFMRGEWYSIEGRYLEYDGKSFGLGDFEAQIDSFKGPRKITSLASYPLYYHKDAEGLKKQLVERGKLFVALEGMNYRFHKGMAFQKKKKTVAKVNINGRIMVDPAIFRRINPNYPISLIKPKDPDEGLYPSDEECSDCCCSSDEEEEEDQGAEGPSLSTEERETKERTKFKVVWDKDDKAHVVQVAVDDEGKEIHIENLDKLQEGVDPKQKREFTEEELLIASPVVVGFAFSEKLWLEFSISGLKDIEWNQGAFESLVLPANQKSIVKALVESHKFHAAKTIDDVVQGKGKGLVAVLHGPPGTGKTLTAEGIAELLKCPLYMVSAGELGTDPRLLEHELQKILDIAHSWGAVLLLDEADVFLEKREVHDIHRNALVSIFLRLLEYFQGILFLTTNRVETFDDAFQSRIHVALRYGELTAKAKKSVWKMFLEKVRQMEGFETDTFKEEDYDTLARNNLNGRQIKNCVRTAQALSVNEGRKLSLEHIRRVLEVAESFEHDLKGGRGYMDAMRSYT